MPFVAWAATDDPPGLNSSSDLEHTLEALQLMSMT